MRYVSFWTGGKKSPGCRGRSTLRPVASATLLFSSHLQGTHSPQSHLQGLSVAPGPRSATSWIGDVWLDSASMAFFADLGSGGHLATGPFFTRHSFPRRFRGSGVALFATP